MGTSGQSLQTQASTHHASEGRGWEIWTSRRYDQRTGQSGRRGTHRTPPVSAPNQRAYLAAPAAMVGAMGCFIFLSTSTATKTISEPPTLRRSACAGPDPSRSKNGYHPPGLPSPPTSTPGHEGGCRISPLPQWDPMDLCRDSAYVPGFVPWSRAGTCGGCNVSTRRSNCPGLTGGRTG